MPCLCEQRFPPYPRVSSARKSKTLVVELDAIAALAAPLEAANKEIAELREAVRVLARDKVHGIADMIGANVLANPTARAALESAKENNQ